ncbi:MAG TPA: M23 family metallopeptidase [Burkholderiales bacterium]|nr:M23 family metallopeptidase [Burkholderiales bacterium]
MIAPRAPLAACFLALFLACSGVAIGQDLCSDYLSTKNCIGKRRPVHHGIDFGGAAGTEVISATYGTVVRRNFDECSGHGLTVKTDFVARHDDLEGPVYVRYAHVEGFEYAKPGLDLKPGDPIGRTIPLRHTKCHGSREHVHYELRINGDPKLHVNPHAFWADGEGKVTCFKKGMTAPAGKAVAPIACGD